MYAHATPKFAQTKGQFVTEGEKRWGETRLMLKHVSKHSKCLNKTRKKHHEISVKLIAMPGCLIFKFLQNKIICTSNGIVWINILQKSFIVKYKYVGKDITSRLESVAEAVGKETTKNFQDFLRDYTDIISKILYFSTDYTYGN